MRERILAAALELFASRGFHATSMRDIANRCGCVVSNIYNFYSSKDEMLLALLRHTAESLTADVERSLLQTGDDAGMRLAVAVGAHVKFHITRQSESFLASSELRSLQPADRDRYVRQRDDYELIFGTIIGDGVRSGALLTEHPREATRAILAMCTAVATWFRPDGELSVDQVCSTYAALALSTAQCDGPPEFIAEVAQHAVSDDAVDLDALANG